MVWASLDGLNSLMPFTPLTRRDKFQAIINQRGQRLRELPFEELRRLTNEPTEHLTLESRTSTISIIVQPQPSGGVRVVVQGFMMIFWGIKRVALDGFYMYPDETIATMPSEEFWEFD